MLQRIFFFIFFANCVGWLWSLDPQKKVTQYTISTWKTERGLPNNTVLAIAQDHSGYLWLGTSDGLVRFDGLNFTVFKSRNTDEFQGDFISNLLVDRRGTLWIGALRGKLFSLVQGKFKNHSLAGTITGMSSNCIVEDGQGDLWVGTTEGLFYCSPADNGNLKKDPTFYNAKILCLAKDRSGRLMVSMADQGIYRLEKKQWSRIETGAEKLGREIIALLDGRDGYLWIGTTDGLYRLRENKLLDLSSVQGLNKSITVLVEDRDGNLWVGSEGGLSRRQNNDFQSMNLSLGLDTNYIYSVFEDAEGSLWVGAIDGGLTQVRDEKITAFTDREGLRGGKFRCLHDDAAGALWIGGYGGYLSRLKNGRCESFRLPVHLKNNDIYSLEKDGDGSMWLGTDGGLIFFHEGRFQEISLPGANPNIAIRCISKDRDGRLWIGTWGLGLFCRQNEKIVHYATADGLPDSHISMIFEDRKKNLWIGSETGMVVLPPGESEKFIVEKSLNNCYVLSMHEDLRGVIWVGTRQGLKVLAGGRWGSLNSDRGLFDSRIYAILEDGLGYLWLSSELGIFRAGKDELQKAAFDKQLMVSGRLFDENDGMRSRICNFGHPAAWKDGRGRLWFANLVGTMSIDPARILKNKRVPPVRLEAARVDNQRFMSSGTSMMASAQLPAGSRNFELKYTALSFIRSDKIEFKYKLEGYDRDWTAAGNRRQAFYNNLKPGQYRFRVIAANADGVWNQAGAAFSFYLRPFIYQTWWFMVLAALAFSALSALLWQLLKRYLLAIAFWKKKTQIGHFKILETIGSGGMATVYKAQDLLNKKRLVALKVLKEENFQDEAQKKRFKHESLITEQLDHKNIVRILERGEMDDCWYIAMELLQGKTLSLLIKEGGRMEIAAALSVMLQLVDALQAIHGLNIVHRDLKPENIMVQDRDGRPFIKLLDFGLAITPAQSRLTMSGVVMGTIRYLPPERISDGTSSPAGDIYSAGVIFYEMLTGSKPFWSEATGEVIHRILKTYPLAPREISAGVPRALNGLIMAMIDKDPQRRPDLESINKELQRVAKKFRPVS